MRALSDPVLNDISYKNTFHRIRWFISNVFNAFVRGEIVEPAWQQKPAIPHRCQLLEGCRSLAGSNLHGRHTASFTPFTPKKVQAWFLASQNGNKCRKQIQAVNVFTDVPLQPSALPTPWKNCIGASADNNKVSLISLEYASRTEGCEQILHLRRDFILFNQVLNVCSCWRKYSKLPAVECNNFSSLHILQHTSLLVNWGGRD